MRELSHKRVPVLARWLIRLAAGMVPRPQRAEWRARWGSGLREWWVLIERGELIYLGAAQIVMYCRPAFAEAFWLRFNRQGLRALVRSPLCPLATLAAAVAAAGVLTHGFSATRTLLASAQTWHSGLSPSREDFLVGHVFSLAFGLAIGMGVAAFQRLPLRWYGWHYWSYFLLKTASVFLATAVLWIEGGAAVRARVLLPDGAGITAGALFWVLSMPGFGIVMGWSFRDQRRRCPVCLSRLSLPVPVGSWSSVLEPAAVELLCDRGHGSLCMTETQAAGPDRWTVLGPSWQDLFETGSR